MELRAQIASLFRPRNDIYEDAVEGRRFHLVYFGMLVFACLISLFGLLLNSPAVIIGAMLISPLMGPLLASGLALATAEWSLGIKSARNLLFSVVETVSIAALATYLSPLHELTPEILARTNPNLIDLLIALFSGLAGTLAFSSRKGAVTILPGVAIATALMPPLATIGYGVSTARWDVASGAFMLFLTNFTAIIFSAAVGFFFIGFRPSHRAEMHGLLVRWRIAIALLILAALAVPLMQTLIHAARQQRIHNQVEEVLTRELDHDHEEKVSGLSVRTHPGEVSVTASVQTLSYIDSDEVQKIQSALEKTVGEPVRLRIRQLQLARKPSDEDKARDFVAGGAIKQVAAQESANPAKTIANVEGDVSTYLADVLAAADVKNVNVHSLGTSRDGALVVGLTADEGTKSDQATWNAVAAALAKQVDAQVQLGATLTLAGAKLEIPFQADSGRLSTSAALNVRLTTAQWKRAGYERCEVSAAGDDLSAGRLVALRRAAHCDIVQSEKSVTAVDPNTVTLQPVRDVVCRAPQQGTRTDEDHKNPAQP